jgi:hypothetical protein
VAHEFRYGARACERTVEPLFLGLFAPLVRGRQKKKARRATGQVPQEKDKSGRRNT